MAEKTVRQKQWEDALKRLRAYVREHGTSLVPQRYEDDGFPLGTWVHTQRKWKKSGRLSDDRIAALEAVPTWVWNTDEAFWSGMLEALRTFERTTRGVIAHGRSLGEWVIWQRRDYRRGRLQDVRRRQLAALRTWEWEGSSRGRARKGTR